MKSNASLWLGLAVLGGLALGAHAQVNHRLSLQGRVGFNIDARFEGGAMPLLPPAQSGGPAGDGYRFDDGYVLTDVSGNLGDQSWYWGYSDSARQISGNNILMSRALSATPESGAAAEDGTSWGSELVYDLLIFYPEGGFSVGLQAAANYQFLDLSSQASSLATVQREVYPFAFTPGTTPPTAIPGQPYQGTFNGPGFLISSVPGSPSIVSDPGAAVIYSDRKLEANLWGLRLGPSVEVPLHPRLSANFSFGAAAGYLDAEVSWTQTAQAGGATRGTWNGSARDSSLLLGVYGGITLHYQLSKNFGLNVGAYYQHLEDYTHDFGGQSVTLDMEDTVFLNFGVSVSF